MGSAHVLRMGPPAVVPSGERLGIVRRMTVCPRCGSANPAGNAACASCGNALAPSPGPAPRGQFKQTMLGGAGASVIPAVAPAPSAPPSPGQAGGGRPFGGTMIGGLGGGPPGPSPQPSNSSPPPGPNVPAHPAAGAPLQHQGMQRAFGGTVMGGVGPAPPAPHAAPMPAFSGATTTHGLGTANPAPTQGQRSGAHGANAGPPAHTHAPTLMSRVHGQPPTSAAAPGPAPANPAFAGTMIGVAAPGLAHAPQPSPTQPMPQSAAPSPGPAPGGAFKQTMLAGAFAPPAEHRAPNASALGAPPAGPVSTTPGAVGGAAPLPGGAAGPLQGGAAAAYQGSSLALDSAGRTMVAGATPFTEPAPAVRTVSTAPPPMLKQTVMGVALPGIAPASSAAPQISAPPVEPLRVSIPDSRRRREPAEAARVPKAALVLITVASALILAGVAFALLWEPPRPMSGKVDVTEDGGERLVLTCDDCPDGTVLKSFEMAAKTTGGRVEFVLKKGLPVGENTISVSVERPGMGRNEVVELVVPVAYRVYGDFGGLAEDPPKLRVAVQAEKGAGVLVDGKALALDAHGFGSYAIDVAEELIGAKDTVVSLERKVPYTVTTADAEAHRGEVTVRIGVTPLRVDAPGEGGIVIDTEHFMLTGRTANEGVLTVSNRPITVDATGRFSQLMNVSSVGQTNIVVRATATNHAPRTMVIRVKRVDDLANEAKVFRQRATSDYAKYGEADSASGQDVEAAGRVLESRVDNHTTVAVIEVTDGCVNEPCLARVVHGTKLAIARDDRIAAFGRVTRMVDGPRSNQRIPEVRAEFVLKEP
jgi:hypothetical protein